MKILLSAIILLFSVTISFAQSSVTVLIEDLRNNDGLILIRMLNEKDEQVQQQAVEIHEGKVSTTFENVPSGKYAISYFHDENKNSELDTGTMGIPSEGYGFSNDARGFMGPPNIKDQIFDLSSDTSMTLKTKYW